MAEMRTADVDNLLSVLAALNDEDTIFALLEDLFTPREIKETSQRLAVARLLSAGRSYASIRARICNRVRACDCNRVRSRIRAAVPSPCPCPGASGVGGLIAHRRAIVAPCASQRAMLAPCFKETPAYRSDIA